MKNCTSLFKSKQTQKYFNKLQKKSHKKLTEFKKEFMEKCKRIAYIIKTKKNKVSYGVT